MSERDVASMSNSKPSPKPPDGEGKAGVTKVLFRDKMMGTHAMI